MVIEDQINMKELQKIGIKIDWLDKNITIGYKFFMNEVMWVTIGNRKAIMAVFENELFPVFTA